MDVDPLNIVDHRVEIATHAINPVGLPARAVDRTRHDLHSIVYQSFETLLLGVVQIDPVLHRDRDSLAVCVFQNLEQMRIQKYLAVIGNLDPLQIWIEVQEPLKVLEFEKAAADRWMNCATCR